MEPGKAPKPDPEIVTVVAGEASGQAWGSIKSMYGPDVTTSKFVLALPLEVETVSTTVSGIVPAATLN